MTETVGPERWLSVPEVAELLAVPARSVRGLLADRSLLGVRPDPKTGYQIPEEFVVRAGESAGGQDGPAVLASLRGTITVLLDAGLTEAEILTWLFTPAEELGASPVQALRAGRTHPVRRAAQLLSW